MADQEPNAENDVSPTHATTTVPLSVERVVSTGDADILTTPRIAPISLDCPRTPSAFQTSPTAIGIAQSPLERVQTDSRQQFAPRQSPITREQEPYVALYSLNKEFIKGAEKQSVKFSGVPLEYQSWEKKVQRLVTTWSDHSPALSEYTKLHYAQGTLTGEASTWFASIDEAAQRDGRKPFATLVEFFEATRQEFDIRNKEQVAFGYLTDLRSQQKDMAQYVSTFNMHMYNADGMSEELKNKFFYKGLEPAISDKVKSKLSGVKTPSFNMIRTAAHEAEADLKKDNSYAKRRVPQPERDLSPKRRAMSKYNPEHTCASCNRTGHLAIDCRTYPAKHNGKDNNSRTHQS